MNEIANKIKQFCARYSRRLDLPPRLEATPDEIRCIGSADKSWLIPWIKIRKIAAFKRDLVSTDLICWEFELEKGSDFDGEEMGFYEINEEIDGFKDVEREAIRRKMVDPRWIGLVMKPAFATCWTVIYDSSVPNAAPSALEAPGEG